MSVRVMTGDQTAAPLSEEPTFTVLDVESVRHAATPTLRFDLHVTDPAGRGIYAIALSTQVQIQPAKRTYDEETQARLVELFDELGVVDPGGGKCGGRAFAAVNEQMIRFVKNPGRVESLGMPEQQR